MSVSSLSVADPTHGKCSTGTVRNITKCHFKKTTINQISLFYGCYIFHLRPAIHCLFFLFFVFERPRSTAPLMISQIKKNYNSI